LVGANPIFGEKIAKNAHFSVKTGFFWKK